MAVNVKGSALAVGDVIQDRNNTGDDHPYVVVSKETWTVTLRNCTSHETSGLTLLKVLMADKTGDVGWAGKDSYVVKSGDTTNLWIYRDTSYQSGFQQVVVPDFVPQVFQTPTGPVTMHVQVGSHIEVHPRIIQRYSDITFRRVGTIVATRMGTLLTELAS